MMQNTIQQFWYEKDNNRIGPVDEQTLESLIDNGTLNSDSVIWYDGITDWTALKDSDYNALLKRVPPQLSGERIDNRMVWWIAFAPLIGQFIEGILLEITDPVPENGSLENLIDYAWRTDFNKYWFISLGLNILLCYLDEKRLKKAGVDTSKFESVFLIPYYLYRRAELLKQKNTYFWIWCVCFLIIML